MREALSPGPEYSEWNPIPACALPCTPYQILCVSSAGIRVTAPS